LGYAVWYDEFELKLGDSLRRKIDQGLKDSKFGIVILSPSFFAKNWPQYELSALTAVEIEFGRTVIIPVWHDVVKKDVLNFSPALADKVAVVSTLPLGDICKKIAQVLGNPINDAPNLDHRPADWDEETCPRCGQKGEVFGYEGSDGDEAAWFECPHCGYFSGIQ